LPSFQSGLANLLGNHRGVPDIAAVGNPNTGVWIYDSYQTDGAPWNIIGGTSVAAPLWAGIVNSAGSFKSSSRAELTLLYSANYRNVSFRDITDGGCGHHYS
jgi:subtilase family serine protease